MDTLFRDSLKTQVHPKRIHLYNKLCVNKYTTTTTTMGLAPLVAGRGIPVVKLDSFTRMFTKRL